MEGNMLDVIQFEKTKVIEYLDACIRHWRRENELGNITARYYIDAFQSVRISLFGELLPPELPISSSTKTDGGKAAWPTK